MRFETVKRQRSGNTAMQSMTFKTKILILFTVLALAIGGLFVHFIYTSYKKSSAASTQFLAAGIALDISDLIRNIQAERRLGAWLLMPSHATESKVSFEQQCARTDRFLKQLIHDFETKTPEKMALRKILEPYNALHRARILKMAEHIGKVRQEIRTRSRTFRETVEYYQSFASEVLYILNGLLWITRYPYAYGTDIYHFELLIEYASLEQIHVENLLLSRRYFLREISIIRDTVTEQRNNFKIFVSSYSPEVDRFFRQIVDTSAEHELQDLRRAFFQYRLNYLDAKQWWKVSSRRIRKLNDFLVRLNQKYFERMQYKINQVNRDHRLLWLFGITVTLAMVTLIYTLLRLLRQEERLLDDLRVASFAFESHEGMVVTDADGVILKVNRAFVTLTGYSPDEILGTNLKTLKSDKYPATFYETLWHRLLKEGRWSGEIITTRKNGEERFEQLSIAAIKNSRGTTTHYIVQFLDVTELKQVEQEVRYQATHDSLTQLFNRNSMLQRLSEEFARARRHHFFNAFFFIDVDDFKKVNDLYGHAAGDVLLQTIADRLKKNVRSEDCVARISGDEFCLLLVNIGSDEQRAAQAARQAALKITRNLEEPYTIDGIPVHASVSIGIKLFPDGDKDIEEVINDADTAMYHAKENGKHRFVFFDRAIEHSMQEQAKLEAELRSAIIRDEFLFYYQPKVSVETDRIVGAELLMRWQHPRRGLLYPAAFMDVLKNSSMIREVVNLSLEKACQFFSKNSELFPGTLSINVSSIELRVSGYAEQLRALLDTYGIDPGRFEVEILENDLIENFDTISETLHDLRAEGIRITIDDFGIGHSSINYLHTLPVDTIKIDRAYTINLHEDRTRELVKVIIRFAHILGIQIVLEGIDESFQLEFARENGVEIYQGFLFSAAVNESSFYRMLIAHL